MVTDLERNAALHAVRSAATLCSAAQGRLVAGETLTKGDDSPVTVADFGAQAVVVEALTDRLGSIELVGEEDPADLASDDQASLRDGVTALVSTQLGHDVAAGQVLDWIGVGPLRRAVRPVLDPRPDRRHEGLPARRPVRDRARPHRGRRGRVGCARLPQPSESRRFHRCGLRRVRRRGRSPTRPGRPIRSGWGWAEPATLAEARFCESVESGHSSHDDAAEIASRLGIVAEPYRIDSQCKYAAVARGDASIYLRLPTRPGYREKIWDHAAGKFVVEQAGGVVTDVDGAPLDFRHGRRLEENRGIVATDGRFHDRVIEVVRDVLA